MPQQPEKVRVLIPTTAGLAEVLLLTEEDPAIGRSVACIGGSTRTADIDADYNAFVARATGVVERLFGHPCYRLDVSDRIDAGSSWQLGVLTAHALRAAGRLAREGEAAQCVLCATGSVRSVDLTVGCVDHVAEKLAGAMERLALEARSGRSVLIAVPEANASHVTSELHAKLASLGLDEIEVGSIEPLWDRLELSSPVLREQIKGRRQLRLRTAVAAFMGGLAFVAAAAAWTASRQSLEAERRLAIALEASSGITRMAMDFRERFGVTAPQLSERLHEADLTLQRLSSAQSPGMSLAEFTRTLKRLSENVGATPEFQHRKAQTLLALSENYATLGRSGEQLTHASASRKLLAGLVAHDGTEPEWQRDLGRAYIAEGDALRSQGKGEAAFGAYSEALRLRTRLAAEAPQGAGRQEDLASSMGRVGDLLAERGDYDGALMKFDEALKLLERLAAREPAQPRWRRDIAASHGKIAEALLSRGDASGALQSFRKSDSIMAGLVAADPNNTRWLRELSIWKERIGDILLDRADLEKALTNYQSSLQLRRRLTESDPNHIQWQLDLAYAHSKLADAESADDPRRALATRREAHALVMRVASGVDTSTEVRRALLGSHLNLGVALQHLGMTEEAAPHFQTALEQARYLVDSDPANAQWRDDLAIALERLGSNMGARGETGAARENFERAQRIRSELVGLYPGRRDWRRNKAVVEREMSLARELEGDIDQALQLASGALASIEDLAARDLESRGLQKDLSLSHQRLAEPLLRKGRVADAIGHLEKALAILEVDPEAAGREWQWDLVATRVRLADALLAGDQMRRAEQQLQRGKELAERLHRSDPAYAPGVRALYTIYARVSYIDQAHGRTKRSLDALRRCRDLAAALVDGNPQNHDLKHDLALAHRSIGDALVALPGKRKEALSAYRQAIGLLEPLTRSFPSHLALQRTLADTHRRIATLLAQEGDREAELKELRTARTTLQRLAATSPDDPALTSDLAWFEKTYRLRAAASK
jgi:tetratricopeptide (TPR) repeat protein